MPYTFGEMPKRIENDIIYVACLARLKLHIERFA